MADFIFEDEPFMIYFDPKTPTIGPERLIVPEPEPLTAPSKKSIQYVWDERVFSWQKLYDDDPDPPSNLEQGDFDGQIIDIIIDD